jgi:hypothetical protein
MEKKIDAEDFLKLLRAKKRKTIYTEHSIQRAKARKLISNGEATIKIFEKDLEEKTPDIVVEQTSENPDERKFKIYYRSSETGFYTYVITINGGVRLITAYKTSKSLQRKVYKHLKRGIHI